VALLWKMICNLGDPMSLRHPVQDIQNRFRERNAQLLYKYRHLSNFQIRILIPISVSFLVVCGGRQNPCCELTCKRLSIIAHAFTGHIAEFDVGTIRLDSEGRLGEESAHFLTHCLVVSEIDSTQRRTSA